MALHPDDVSLDADLAGIGTALMSQRSALIGGNQSAVAL